jgi:serine/threonine protein kinase/Leucine-rich repeat (LRR) protein
MTESKRNEPGLNSLVEQLADADLSDREVSDSTLKQTRAELETLVSDLRSGPPNDGIEQESAFQHGLDLVKQFGCDPSLAETGDPNAMQQEPSFPASIREYKLLSKLGQGGMGTVYKALHTKLDKVVALKVLAADRMQEATVQRFEREMKAIGKLEHPNIVRAMDAGEADGQHYLVMELVDGVDLSRLLRESGPLTIANACELIRQAALGLQEAHEHAMVHRDVKPSNLMLARVAGGRKPPRVKILDMGLALLDEQPTPEQRELTGQGQLMGTLDYMAPEQGLDAHDVDIRADIYALGASLYKLLTGKAIYPADKYVSTMQLLMAIANEPAPAINDSRDDVPVELGAVIDRMLAKDPAERFATPVEIVLAMEPYVAGCDLAGLLDGLPDDQDQSISRALPRSTVENLSSASGDTTNVMQERATPATGVAIDHGQKTVIEAMPRKVTRARRQKPTNGHVKWIAGSLAAMVILAAAAFQIRISTGTGELVIISDDPNLKVKIFRNDELVENVELDRNEKRVVVRSGTYQVQLDGEYTGVAVMDGEFTLTRDDRQVVRIVQQAEPSDVAATDVPASTPVAATTDPDRRAAQAVVSAGGRVGILISGRIAGRWIDSADEVPSPEFKVRGIELLNNQRPLDELLAVVSNLSDLGSLDLTNSPSVTDAGIANLKNLPKLSSIKLLGTAVTDVSMEHIARFDELELLYLQNTSVTDAGALCLTRLAKLKALDLAATKVTDAGMAHVAELAALENVGLGGTRVSRIGLEHLKRLPNLNALRIQGTDVAGADILVLNQFPQLETLCVGVKQLSREGGRHISQLPSLRFLTVSQAIRKANYEFLANMSNLIGFKFEHGKFTDDDLIYIRDLQQLKNVRLWGTQVTDAGLSHLRNLTNLELLELEHNYAPVTRVTGQGVAVLREALPKCRIVTDDTVYAWQPTSKQQAVLDALAKLPSQDRVQAVSSTLKKFNPGFDGQLDTILSGDDVSNLALTGSNVVEIWPVVALTGITSLDISGTAVADLTPLGALTGLKSLKFAETPVRDLGSLRSLKQLKYLDCVGSAVHDLWPLTAMPLTELRCPFVTAYDETAVKVVNSLASLNTINDLTPAEWLDRRDQVEQLCELSAALTPADQLERVVELLKEFNPGFDGQVDHRIEEGRIVDLMISFVHSKTVGHVTDISPVRALPLTNFSCQGTRVCDLSPLSGMPLTALDLYSSQVSDLSPLMELPLTFVEISESHVRSLAPLRGMNLTSVSCSRTHVSDLLPLAESPLTALICRNSRLSDLSPLSGMSLTSLTLSTNRSILDLSPLRGMPLTYLDVSYTSINDLSPLEGMKLETLFCIGTRISDLSPLAGMNLKDLQLQDSAARDSESFLQEMPTLQTINKLSRAEFFKSLQAVDESQEVDPHAEN